MLFPTLKTHSNEELGRLLLSWRHDPSTKQRAAKRLLWLLALAAVILLALSPLAREKGGTAGALLGYALLVAFSSLLPRLWRAQVPHYYELREHGLLIFPASDKGKETRFARWGDFRDVSHREGAVILVPKSLFLRPVRLPTGARRFDAYFVCREKVWQSNYNRLKSRLSVARAR
jgi:hypothetical protein